ncbi:uncharacterized protein ATNIH1004_011075 [Aspergillus tanneri]|uniref:Uncharacterized protein n=1 Tax=Aspergillus tanneri TaxID=1220188 RepID=A0A5M9M9Y0_9EURO|nr:uncharacterized protein ATNIH1004_011075 [Aspergillus tanneri]KAA8642134.1 hypothetical protein ATNIH1004_011075 [Aspergillus tanneri]
MFGFSFKRQREPEELTDVDSGATHESKKLCPLSLRTEPNASRKSSFTKVHRNSSRFGLSSLTPVESSDDDDDGDDEHTTPHPLSACEQGSHDHALRTEMDIDDTFVSAPSSQPIVSDHDGNVQPSPIPNSLINQSLTLSERQELWATVATGTEDQEPAFSVYNGQESGEIHNHTLWCDQRLPSPISDCGDVFRSSKESVGGISMMHDKSHPTSFLPSDECNPTSQQYIPSIETPTEAPSTPKSNTNPNKKIIFSMGFRADCDKCHRKVPGHYSHINRR